MRDAPGSPSRLLRARKVKIVKPKTKERIEPSVRLSLGDMERLVGLDFIRATECAALNGYKWMGKGEKELADYAACDAIRGLFDTTHIATSPGPQISGTASGSLSSPPFSAIFRLMSTLPSLWLPGTTHRQLAAVVG